MARAFPVRRVTKPERDQHELDPIANVAGVTPKPSLQPADKPAYRRLLRGHELLLAAALMLARLDAP